VVEFKIDEDGFMYLDINIKERNSSGMLMFSYKVDTGADCTTININQLKALGYDENWIIKNGKKAYPTTASGQAVKDCYNIVLPYITIGNWVGHNWKFMTSLSAKFRLLLGTDTLKYFNWQIFYNKGVCRYSLENTLRNAEFNSARQSIHDINFIH